MKSRIRKRSRSRSKIKIRIATRRGLGPNPTLYLALNHLPNLNPPLTPTPLHCRTCQIARNES